MIRKFVNRKNELGFLERKYKEKESSCIVLYGRRRTGKTELIRQFCLHKPSLYFLADKRGTLANAELFAKETANFFHDTEPRVQNFDDVFSLFSRKNFITYSIFFCFHGRE